MTERRSPATPGRAPSTFPNAGNHVTAVRAYRRGTCLWDCGHRVPAGADECRRCEPVTGRQAEAAAEALDMLARHGYPGLADTRTCRALWRIGRRDLAAATHQRTMGGSV
ncbi:hypothetical protein LAUMK40_01438 [Mycobacterium kansasii]|nr:hypothetical protein LAUMK40_01438 [Mycobacterium kansasii]